MHDAIPSHASPHAEPTLRVFYQDVDRVYPLTDSLITLGRLAHNTIVVPLPVVADLHAVLIPTAGGHKIIDQQTENGLLYRGQYVSEHLLHDGDVLRIRDELGNLVTLTYSRETPTDEPDESVPTTHERNGTTAHGPVERVRLDALHVQIQTTHHVLLLHDISLAVHPGEMVAIVGGSGTGKSTLMNVLSGTIPATGGLVLANGYHLSQIPGRYRRTIGYVPQDDILHQDLTVERTLSYAACLRLPATTSATVIAQLIDEVLGDVGLAGTAKSPLSGRTDHRP
jgi:ABC-type bacteriocin/lantibiotic exporter with double-glycine peptidase domain